MSRNGKFYLIFIGFIFLVGCIIVKEKATEEEFTTEFTILEKPSIPIGYDAIRSERGDMIAFLPQKWFFIDTEDKGPSSVFSVAVNPEYSLSIIFSRLTYKMDVSSIIKKDGLLGIAAKCFEIKQIKSSNNIKLIGNFEPIKNGPQKFYVFAYENVANKLKGKSAVFVTSLNEVYEFSLIQLDIEDKQQNSETEFNNVFFSVLSTIRF